MSRFCATCGSSIAATDTACPVCGEPVEPAPGTKEGEAPATADASTEPGASSPAVAVTTGTQEAPPPSTSVRDYLLSGIGAVVLTVIVFIVSAPEERKGPPVDMQAQASGQAQAGQTQPGPAALPPAGPTPEQQAQIAELEKQVKANPDDLDASLKLANLYYDTEAHEKAIPLYTAYLKVHPDNSDARTDMAFSMAASGDLEDGISQLTGVIRKDPKQQKATFNLAVMYMMKRNRDSTMYWIRKVVEIDSTTPVGRNAAAILRDVNAKRLQSASGTGPADSAAADEHANGAGMGR